MQRSGRLCSLQGRNVDTVSMEDILNMTRYWSTEDWRDNMDMIENGDIMFYFYIVKQEEEIRYIDIDQFSILETMKKYSDYISAKVYLLN